MPGRSHSRSSNKSIDRRVKAEQEWWKKNQPIIDLLKQRQKPGDIAREHRCTIEYVHRVAERLCDIGVLEPLRRRALPSQQQESD